MTKNSEEFEIEEVVSETQNLELPEYGSEGWEEAVMSSFNENELYQGQYPSLNGMRRVALKVFGPPDFSGPQRQETSLHEPYSSFCVYRLDISGRTFLASADANEYNVSDKMYGKFKTAIAESRAEARTYRKALLLSTVSMEEISDNNQDFTSVLKTENLNNDKEGPIKDQQVNIIKNKCKKYNIDMTKFVQHVLGDKEDLTIEDGITLTKEITKYQQDNSQIPSTMKKEG